MELWEAMEQRHSVRAYQNRPIAGEVKEELEAWIAQCNREGGLHMQLILDEPRAFSGGMARYGKFSGVRNYIAVVGPKGPGLEEACGYYGEKVVLKAQQLGLNTCWVALTYRKVKTAFTVAPGEKLCLVITIGYGKTAGQPHQGKPPEAVMQCPEPVPNWFLHGVQAALLAPTAMNQQKFRFQLEGSVVRATPGRGFYTKIDLGIAKYQFELGAAPTPFTWGRIPPNKTSRPPWGPAGLCLREGGQSKATPGKYSSTKSTRSTVQVRPLRGSRQPASVVKRKVS